MSREKQEQLNTIIQEAVDGKDLRSKMDLRKVTPDEAAEIMRQSGPDVSGFVHEITAKELRHALNQHGQADEAVRHPGQRPHLPELAAAYGRRLKSYSRYNKRANRNKSSSPW